MPSKQEVDAMSLAQQTKLINDMEFAMACSARKVEVAKKVLELCGSDDVK